MEESKSDNLRHQLEVFDDLLAPQEPSQSDIDLNDRALSTIQNSLKDTNQIQEEQLQQNNGQVQQQNQQQPQQQQQQQVVQQIEILGAVKVRDGLFLGDEFASQDLEFVIANKVTHIINCAGRQIFNQWTPVGVKYLTFYWLDDDRQLIFDDHDQVAKEIFDFIEEANQEACGILVHSVRGQSRACCVLSIYLMMKFRWTLLKSLEFINSRRPNLEIRGSFLQQLSAWEKRTRDMYPQRTDGWEQLFEHLSGNPNLNLMYHVQHEELLLRNTYLNAQIQPVNYLQQWKEDVLTSISQSGRNRTKLKWGDNNEEEQKKKLIRENSDEDLINKEEKDIMQIQNHRKEFRGKSIIKKKAVNQHTPINKQDNNAQEQIQMTPAPANKAEISNSALYEKQAQKQKQQRKRPVTPLLNTKQKDSSDLLSASSPRSFQIQDEKSLSSSQQIQSLKGSIPKRSSSSKKIDKTKEDKEKRDKYKAKIAWNATSPRGIQTSIVANINFSKDNSDQQIRKANNIDKSPNKGSSSSILKRELLEKAKKALSENAKVNIGLDIKKIQETLNKINKEEKPLGMMASNSAQAFSQPIQKTQGNIINNNNINNFFIQNTSVIEIPVDKQSDLKSNDLTQAPIGQHHHKRANSGSLQIAQQIKQGLASSNPIVPNQAVVGQHRKNKLSEQFSNQPSAVGYLGSTTNVNDIYKNLTQRPPVNQDQFNQGQKVQRSKDFKQMIKKIQKDTMTSQMQNSQQFWMTQAKKFNQKKTNQGMHQEAYLQLLGIGGSKHQTSQQIIEAMRPGSAQGLNMQNRLNSSFNKNRKLKKSNEFLPNQQNPIQLIQPNKGARINSRRAQTPMPTSPKNNMIQGSNEVAANSTVKIQAAPGLSVQNLSLNNTSSQAFLASAKLTSNKPLFKKRSKSPSVVGNSSAAYNQKLQAKNVYMLMNNTGVFQNPHQMGSQNMNKNINRKNKSSFQSPAKNTWFQ